MKIKTTFAAALLVLSPTFALAQGCNSDYMDQHAMSCADGSAYDEATQTCIPIVTG